MKKYALLSVGLVAMLASCSDDDVTPSEPVNEEEVITKMTVNFVPEGGGDTLKFTFEDADGPGGNDPVITKDDLKANTVYNTSIGLWSDEGEDIAEEVSEEDNEHQFFFEVTDLNATYVYDDEDGDGNPVGLKTIWTTTDASTGDFQVILRHEPNKSASGVSEGDITNAGGETDIEVVFEDVKID